MASGRWQDAPGVVHLFGERRHHAMHFTALAEHLSAGMRTPLQQACFDEMKEETPQFRRALGWEIERGEAELALRLVIALAPLWHVGGL